MGTVYKNEDVIDVDSETRTRIVWVRQGKRLVNFVRQLEIMLDDEWLPIVRYDCFHGFLHKDVYFPNGTKKKVRMNVPFRNMREALKLAERDLSENYKDYIKKVETMNKENRNLKYLKFALEAERKLIFRILDNPKEFNKLPEKSIFLPREKLVIPIDRYPLKKKMIGDVTILPRNHARPKKPKGF